MTTLLLSALLVAVLVSSPFFRQGITRFLPCRIRSRREYRPRKGALRIDHAAIGISAQAMQSMAIRGFIAHNRESGAYTLTDSGRATLTAILEDAEIGITPNP
jgi:hypothetical protein